MLGMVIVGCVCIIIGMLFGYIWLKQNYKNKFLYLEYEAKAKATVIENEAKLLLTKARATVEKKRVTFEQHRKQQISEIKHQEEVLVEKEKTFDQKLILLHAKEQSIEEKINQLDSLEVRKEEEIHRLIAQLEAVSALTKEEAKTLILEKVEEVSRAEVSSIVRKYEQEAKQEGEKKANYILAQATTRYAGDFAGERLIHLIHLSNNEDKGRIIGKDGRNIKTLELLLGVDIVVDETPDVILVSSFNLYRRSIATKVLEILIKDGRIHPARIEEVHAKVQEEFEAKIYEEGENIIIDLGIFPMHEDLVRLLGRMRYRASYGQNALAHTLEVAKLASVMAAEMGGDEKLALRAGLLHDIGKALTQDMGGSHVDIGADLCRKYGEHPTVINAIYAHHGHEEPDSVESAAVCAADALSAARPGARREVLESFTKRVTEIEEIALSKDHVLQAYAINAAREIRVFVNAKKMSDKESVLLSKEIAKEIAERVQFPGKIKVNVIREIRATAYAK